MKADDVEQLALAMAPAEGAEWGSQGTAADALERYENSELRQIVLIMRDDVYDRVMPIITRIMDEQRLETNTEVILYLLDKYGPPAAVSAEVQQ